MDLESTNYAVFVGMLVLSIGLWCFALQLLITKRKLILPNRLRDSVPLGLVDVILVFAVCWIFAQLIGLSVMSWLNGGQELDRESSSVNSQLMICMSVSQLILMIVCMVFFRLRYQSTRSFGGYPKHIFKDIKIGAVGFLFIIPPVLLIQNFASRFVKKYEHGTLDALSQADNYFPILATWFSAVLVAPLVEEFFYRGVLQSWLQRIGNVDPEQFNYVVGGGDFTNLESDADANLELDSTNRAQVKFDSRFRWIPIFVTSAMFSASHIGQGAAWIPLFFLSVALGYLFRQTGSIVPCIVVHVLLNFYTMFWATLVVAMT